MALNDLTVKFKSDTSDLTKGFRTAESGIKKMSGGIANLVKSAAAIAGVTLSVKALADSFKVFTKLESNMSRTSDIFGAATQNIQAFAEGSAKSFGLAESAVYEYSSTFGNLFKNITASTTENSAVTIKMLQASAVVASKTGRTMEDVMDRIRSGLLGSTEAIEDLGIHVNISMLEMTDAFKRIADGRSWNQLTFYEQQQIRTLGILEQAHKNFGDTVQHGSAYSLSVLSAAFKDLMATVGSFVNAVLAPVIRALTTIVQLATTALKALAAMLGINASFSGVSDSLGAGAAGAGAMADGLDESAKNAKKLNRQLAGFDKFNDITANAGGGGSEAPSGGASGGGGGMGIEMDFEKLEPPDTSWTDKLLGWAKNFGTLIEPLKSSLDGLWKTLQKVGGFAWDGLKNFYNQFLKPIGTWVLGEGLPRLVNSLRDGLEKIDWARINDAFSKLWTALKPFAINVGEGLLWLWENILVPLGTWTMNEVVPRFVELIATALDVFNTIWEAAKPGLEWLWTEFLKPAADWAGDQIIKGLDSITNGLKKLSDWCKQHKTTIETIAIVAASFAAAWALVNVAIIAWNVAAGIATGVTTAFGVAVGILTSPITLIIAAIGALITIVVLLAKNWDSVKETAANVWEKIKEIWGKVTGWINDNVVQPVTEAFKTFWEGIKSVWSTAATWFTDKVLTPIKSAFTGAINFLIGLAEGFANGFIKGINKIIDALNSISFTIPFIGETFSLNIPRVNEIQIPRIAMAKGNLAYGEVEALVGDNFNARQNPEVIAPLSNLQDMITAAVLQRDIATGGNGGGRQVIEFRLVMEDGTPFIESLIDPMNKTARNLGYSPVFRLEPA